MTTQKAQSKIKSSTIAITILSVLLAVAVAATVVLAAFAVNKQAQTTISFAGGITLTVTGISDTESAGWYTWKTVNANSGSGTEVSEITGINGDSSIYLDKITAAVTGNDAYIAVRAVITKTQTPANASADAPTPAYTGATDDETVTGWNITSLVTAGSEAVTLVDFAEIFNTSTDDANDFAGATFTAKVQIVASDTTAGLSAACAEMAAIAA